ncbi:MAG: hypothetical protein QOJ13_3102 [Gaiellales bacterium]|jgi:hypothetical protein|nr:hypothetical protein [Gaiellales bacterium]
MHQPNYLPWLGYFDKMRSADVFVLLDTVQYPRGRSVANRNTIRTGDDTALLTVPVSVPKGRDGKVGYDEITFADDRWREKHIRTVAQAYAKAPHHAELAEQFERQLTEATDLLDLNLRLIAWHRERFGIETRTPRLSELGDDLGHKTDMIVELCRRFDCDVYLSGTGASAYNDEAQLRAAGIQLRYQRFEHPEYSQTGPGFIPNLAALDALLNCGGWPDSRTS